ncbi:putative zinc-binding alcohol dehydrogenase domain-containing protein cipB [Xylariaceae sp. FL0255]|nr:putative zinc-binding alcohol dehydrogenase domain-containing protein cipB [Xylariaceae sp. FL0255]
MPPNAAAYNPALGKALEVREQPYVEPKDRELVITNRAVSLNPCDFAMRDLGPAIFPGITYPCFGGEDVAGEVIAVGRAVTRFKVGDRVIALALAGFQKYPILQEHNTTKIPDSMSFEEACVLPLCLCTAAACLFYKDHMGLEIPSNTTAAKPTGKTILIWGGSTSVGTNAIQMSVAAGYEVVATSSPHNFEYVRSLGASAVFDYRSDTIVPDLIDSLRGKIMIGCMAIGNIGAPMAYEDVVEKCVAVMKQVEGRRFMMTFKPVTSFPGGVDARFTTATLLRSDVELGQAVWDWLSRGLAAGTYRALPKADIVGQGLEGIQPSLDILRDGVSARKLVVTL